MATLAIAAVFQGAPISSQSVPRIDAIAGRGRPTDVEATPSPRGSGPAGTRESGAAEDGTRPATDPRSAAWVLGGEEGRASTARGSARAAETTRVLVSLKSRDASVRAHEAAHVAAGGLYVTHGASYSYQRGPDGRNYAVGGEVGIDTTVPADPAEVLRKMRIVRAAALAPSEPSAADLAVAAAAAAAEAAALSEIVAERSRGGEAGIAEGPPEE